jgi:hypothetical protein
MNPVIPTLRLSEHFTIAEAVHSDKAIELGINNSNPSRDVLWVMEKTAICMERVRAALGNNSIHVNSFYRSPAVNAAVGSKSTSQHLLGEAVDFICPTFGTPVEICRKLIELKDLIRFDQLILEHSWVHISFAIAPTANRGQVISLLSTGGYANGLTDPKGNKL